MPTDILQAMKDKAASDYPGNFGWQLTKVNEQVAAWHKLQKYQSLGMSTDILQAIKDKAASNFPGNFESQLHHVDGAVRHYKEGKK